MAWTTELHALVAVEHGIRVLAWLKTKDGQKGRNQPQPITPPKTAEEIKAEENRLDSRIDAYLRRTGQKR